MMRNDKKESQFLSHPLIGYVPLDEYNNPYQPKLGKNRHSRTKPITIYKTLKRAVTYSPCDTATEVRMFKPFYEIKE